MCTKLYSPKTVYWEAKETKRARTPRQPGQVIDLSINSAHCDGKLEFRRVGMAGKPLQVGVFQRFVSQCSMNDSRNIN